MSGTWMHLNGTQVYFQGYSRVPCSVRMNRKALHSGRDFLCGVNYLVGTARIGAIPQGSYQQRSYRHEEDGSRSFF